MNKTTVDTFETPTTKLALRDRYLMAKDRIIREIGGLEEMRLMLGLSQRKVCQLLLVDPSAWTRWLRSPQGAPPHIYQALRWLLELKKHDPDAAVPSDFSGRLDLVQSTTLAKISGIESEISELKRSIDYLVTMKASVQTVVAGPEYDHLSQELAGLKAKLALMAEAQKKIQRKSKPRKRPAGAKKSKKSAGTRKSKAASKKTAPKRVRKKAVPKIRAMKSRNAGARKMARKKK